MTVNGRVSFWHAELEPMRRRPPLTGPVEVDVAVVGAGLTGLWTAYYLKKADPSLEVAVVERSFAGYGASGRNGGWLSGLLAGSPARYASRYGIDAVRDLQRAMNETVDEVIDVAVREGIDADVVKGGILRVATTPAQLGRLRASIDEGARFGERQAYLDASATLERVDVDGALGSAFNPHGARLHPAKLVRGLADVVSALGVTIYESTPVTEIHPHEAVTPFGAVTARYVLRATEGFTASLAGVHRLWLPMNSSMIVTEPLGPEVWRHLGWSGCETLSDAAHSYIYAQRTADGRVAIGGRGVAYRFGSRTDRDGDTSPSTVAQLRAQLVRLFPALADAAIDHAWSGVLGVPRDWCSGVSLDPTTGLGWAGGYVGHGVATTNLAGRTLRDLVLGEPTALTALPWVDWNSRPWEPEPLRWLGVRAMYAAYRAADRAEADGRATTSWIATVADRISGR